MSEKSWVMKYFLQISILSQCACIITEFGIRGAATLEDIINSITQNYPGSFLVFLLPPDQFTIGSLQRAIDMLIARNLVCQKKDIATYAREQDAELTAQSVTSRPTRGRGGKSARGGRGGKVNRAAALAGAWLGARLNMLVPERFLYYFMLAVVPVLAVFLLFKRDFGSEDRSASLGRVWLPVLAAVVGLVIGCYDGFFGPGAGAFFILAFTGLCRFDLLTAAGTSKVVNSASGLASMVTFAAAGEVMWSVGLPAALCSIAGSYVGSGLALRGGAKVIRPMFLVVLSLLVVRLGWDLLAP